MNAFKKAGKLSREALLAQIAAGKLREYGVYNRPVAERFAAAIAESRAENRPLKVVAALDNCDTEGVLLEVLRQNPQRVFEGMAIAAYAMNAAGMALHIPEYAAALAGMIEPAAQAAGIELVIGLVNQRAYRGSSLNHIVTMAELADYFADRYTEGVYVSVNGAELEKVAPETKLAALVELSGAKALEFSYRFHLPDAAQLTVQEAGITNGVLRVLTGKNCIVRETERRIVANQKQSCGQCVFCREGLIQLESMQKQIAEGKGKLEYLALTREIGEAMLISTPCSLGQESARLVLSALDHFAAEYEEHIKKKNCPAQLCSALVNLYIDPVLCTGCQQCQDVCPVGCIEGKAGFIHLIDEFDCSKCGKCIAACEAGAVIQTAGRIPKLPDRLTKVGKFKRH